VGVSKSPKDVDAGHARHLRLGAYDPLSRNTSSPTSVSTANMVVLGQMVVTYVITDPPEKFDLADPAFQCHLRSLEPIRTDRLPDFQW